MLLILAPVMLDLMKGVFKVAGFKRIELGFGSADFADQDLEVGRLGVALDESGKSELLGWHRIPPTASIAKGQSSGGSSGRCPILKAALRSLVRRPERPPKICPFTWVIVVIRWRATPEWPPRRALTLQDAQQRRAGADRGLRWVGPTEHLGVVHSCTGLR